MRVTCILCFEVGFEARGMYSKVEKLTCLIITFNGKKKKIVHEFKEKKVFKILCYIFSPKVFHETSLYNRKKSIAILHKRTLFRKLLFLSISS